MKDIQIKKLIQAEEARQKRVINLIASENYVSGSVREALGSIFTNKYAEGYSALRYYAGNAIVDELETLTRKRACALFGLSPGDWSPNVQPYSGSPANLAIFLALVPLGEKIMGLELAMGGHLTHGHRVSATGKLWRQVSYGVDSKTELLDYDMIRAVAKKEKPKIIVAGYTAYSRIIDWKEFRRMADESGALLLADISHIAGLVAGGVYPSPFPYADVVMTTLHKTLRGPRAAIIFSRTRYAGAIDKAVFPGIQGGPHENQIAAMAVALEEAGRVSFKKYAGQVIKNAKVLADTLQRRGWRIVSSGTDTHLFLVDTFCNSVSGKEASDMLELVGIIVNKNAIPYDARSPIDPSGIRVGTPALTTRGMREKEMKVIGTWIDSVLRKKKDSPTPREVERLCKKFPLP